MLEQVITFATKAHGSQMRRGGEEPYINHSIRVYEHMVEFGIDPSLAYVGILHDVLEDTPYYMEEVKLYLPFLDNEVFEALDLVTRRNGESKPEYLERLYTSKNPLALICKSMDALDNSIMSPTGIKFTKEVLGRDPVRDCKRYLKLHKECLSLYLQEVCVSG